MAGQSVGRAEEMTVSSLTPHALIVPILMLTALLLGEAIVLRKRLSLPVII